MIIKNRTNVNIDVRNNTICPNESREFAESIFDIISVHSEIGSVEIITEYSKRFIRNYGNLVAKEGTAKDKNGMKVINVREKTE